MIHQDSYSLHPKHFQIFGTEKQTEIQKCVIIDHLPIQLSTTSVFQMNCRNAELSVSRDLRLSAAAFRAFSFSCRVWQRCAICSEL